MVNTKADKYLSDVTGIFFLPVGKVLYGAPIPQPLLHSFPVVINLDIFIDSLT